MAKLQENPFFILEVSISDTKDAIIEAAEERSFDAPENEDDYEKAKNVLLNPKLRLDAEMGWFLNVDRKLEKEIVECLKNKQIFQSTLSNPLAQFNLERYQLAYQQEVNLVDAVYRLDRIYSKMDNSSVLLWIDKMRDVARYPQIQDSGVIASALEMLLEDIRNVIHEIARSIPRQRYTRLANDAAKYISKPHGIIMEDFFSTYELDVTSYLQETIERILRCIDAVKANVNPADVDALEKVLRPWAKACRPIVMNKANMGLKYSDAESMFWAIRSLSIYLYNEKENAKLALRVAKLLKSCFDYMITEGSIYEQKLKDEIPFLEEAAKRDDVSPGFRDAKIAFFDMRDTMDEKLFFEEGHASEIMQFYRTVFQRNYVPTIEGFLNRTDINADEKKTLYLFAALLYRTMGNSLTWANEFKLAHQIAEKGMQYAKKSSDDEIIASIQKLLDATPVYTPPATVSHTATNSSYTPTPKDHTPTNESGGGGGCFLYIILGAAGAALGGPVGFFIGIWLASKINDD